MVATVFLRVFSIAGFCIVFWGFVLSVGVLYSLLGFVESVLVEHADVG